MGEMSDHRLKLRTPFVCILILTLVAYIVVRFQSNRNKEMVLLALEPGMTQREVESILGKPIMVQTNNGGLCVDWIYRRPIVLRLSKSLNPVEVISFKRVNSMRVCFRQENGSWIVGYSNL